MMGIYVRLLFDVCVVGTLFAWGCRALMFGNFFRFIKRVPPIRGFGTDNEHIITINKLNDALASGGNTSQPAKISIQQEPVNSNSFLFDPLVQGRIFDAPFDAELGHEISNMLTERSSSPIDIEFSSGDETILVDDVSDEMLERIRTEAREAIDTLREEFILQTSTKDTENTHEQFFEESIKEKNENLGGMSAHEPFAENVAQDDLAALRFTNVVQSALTERMQQTIAGMFCFAHFAALRNSLTHTTSYYSYSTQHRKRW